MTGIGELRDRLRALLEDVVGLRAYDTWPGQINPPAAIVKPASGDYSQTFDGLTTHHFDVILAVRTSSLRGAQDLLDDYVSTGGPRSVKDALESETASVNARVIRYRDYGDLEIAGILYAGVILEVDVLDG
jgi:hypothetical protein